MDKFNLIVSVPIEVEVEDTGLQITVQNSKSNIMACEVSVQEAVNLFRVLVIAKLRTNPKRSAPIKKPLPFDNWYYLNEIAIDAELSETGADREMDFDLEKEFNKRYENYVEGFNKSKDKPRRAPRGFEPTIRPNQKPNNQ